MANPSRRAVFFQLLDLPVSGAAVLTNLLLAGPATTAPVQGALVVRRRALEAVRNMASDEERENQLSREAWERIDWN